MKQAGYVVVGVLAGLLLAGVLLVVSQSPAGTPVELQAPPTPRAIEVHVVGAVLRPGVYAFAEGSRVQDAITAAGGFTSDADSNALNLAAKVEDGQQLVVPLLEGSAPGGQPTASFRVLPSVVTTATPSGDLVNINTATAEELVSLPGIGATTAQNIIEYRTEHGPFVHIEDLMNVAGIGPATFDNIRDLITV